jgi:hypothetical protein
MPFSTLKPRANLDASNDAAFGLAQFFQRTLFSSTANFIPDLCSWFFTTATTHLIVLVVLRLAFAAKELVPSPSRRDSIARLNLPGAHPIREHSATRIL